MARGWESKAVEDQQADAGRRPAAGRALTPEEMERRQRIDGLTLGLAESTAQLQAACRPAHRDMLRQRIEAVSRLLAEARGPAGTESR